MLELGWIAAAETESAFLLDLALVLLTAAVVALLMQRMRLALIPGYLVAGAVVGPEAFALVRSTESLDAISHLAIILLLFGIGLQLHLSVLKHNWVRLVSIGVAAVLGCVAVGWPVAVAFGLSAPAALAVAMALSLSSTAVVLRLISDRRELHHTSGRLSLSILVVQDLAVPVMLALLPVIAAWARRGGEVDALPVPEAPETTQGWIDFARAAGLRIGGVAAIVIFGRLALPWIMRESVRGRSTEVLTIIAVAVAVGAAFLTQLMGFSPELGAFLAGFLLADTVFRHHLAGQIAPVRDLFVAVFFTTVGMSLDPAVLADWWWLILLGGAIMSAGKTLVIGVATWGIGATASIATAVALGLAQAGEFSLVLLDAAATQGLIGENLLGVLIAIVVVSLILTPGLAWLGRRAATWASAIPPAPWFHRPAFRTPPREVDASERAKRVIVGGFGPIGRLVANSLRERGVRVTVIELNLATVRDETRHGWRMVYGDVANEEVLSAAGIDAADALVLTVPDEEAALHACAAAKRRNPDVFLLVRTGTTGRSTMAQVLGADHVISEEGATAEEMRRMVLEHFEDEGREEPATV